MDLLIMQNQKFSHKLFLAKKCSKIVFFQNVAFFAFPIHLFCAAGFHFHSMAHRTDNFWSRTRSVAINGHFLPKRGFLCFSNLASTELIFAPEAFRWC